MSTYTHGSARPLTITEKVTASQDRTSTMTYTAWAPGDDRRPPGEVTTLTYNMTTGDLVSVSDPLDHATTFGSDGLGRRTIG